MEPLLQEPVLTVGLRTFLALLFATAAWSKLQRLEEFHGVVRNFRLLPDAATRGVAWLLPGVELAVAAALLVRPWAGTAAVAAAVLLGVFALAMAINVLRGRRSIDCGCFRQGLGTRQPVSWLLVGRNLLLAALALAVAAGLPLSREAAALDLVAGIAAGGTLMLIYLGASLLGGIAVARAPSVPSTQGR